MFEWLVNLYINYLSFFPAWLLVSVAVMFGFLLVLAIWRVIQ